MNLWGEADTDKLIREYTIAGDQELDLKLLPYDCDASLAHAMLLKKLELVNDEELAQLKEGLQTIKELAKKNQFPIIEEDGHTQIECYLTEHYGATGKKIHALRSRNDQVLTALRLYEKDKLIDINDAAQHLIKLLRSMAQHHTQTLMPGYTHMQRAMPTSVATWLSAYVGSLQDDLRLLQATSQTIDQSPLGSAAGFGVPIFNMDKEYTAKQMGFAKVMDNPIQCQLSRGKCEAQIVHTCAQLMLTLNRLATDMVTFASSEFGFIRLDEHIATGSSIMPQKKNPDIYELLRANYHIVLGEEMKLLSLSANLISGYHRDLQLSKAAVINALQNTLASLNVAGTALQHTAFDMEKMENAVTKEMYATEEAYRLVKSGMPFRDAYRKVKSDL